MDRREQLTGDLNHVIGKAFSAEVDDRSVAILACAYIEDALEEAIAVRLVGLTPKLREKIFNHATGFVATFGAKIQLAEALNAIGPDAARDLATMAKIRNKFAHKIHAATFSSSEIVGLTANLSRVDDPALDEEIIFNDEPTGYVRWNDKTPRGRFVYTALQLTTAIHNSSIALPGGTFLRAD